MSDALDAARAALRHERAWLVGGAVRDRLLGRDVGDVDLAVDGDPRAAARHLALAAGGPVFPLSEDFGAWRVLAPDRSWQVDVSALQGGSIEQDLARRDFTVNAIAEPLQGGALVDPHRGADDLAAFRLRMVSEEAFADDPLRTLRLARLACELGLEPDATTREAARRRAPGLERTAGERVFAELIRVLRAERALDGVELMDATGVTDAVLPEIAALRGVQQNRFHHLDVLGHTHAVLQASIDLEADPAHLLGPEHAGAISARLREPLADGLTHGDALRLGALLHDVAKPQTQLVREGVVLGFPGHDSVGAVVARDVLARLRTSERLRAHVAGLTAHHLRLGFLVHRQPLGRRALFGYLRACSPVELDVTLLTVADRLATRGENAREAIGLHVALARTVMGPALAWREESAQTPLVRGDELAEALGLRPGPELGRLLAEVAEARYAGEVSDPDGAIALARSLL